MLYLILIDFLMVMLCLWRYVSVLCRFHLLRSAFMWKLGVSVAAADST